MTGHYKFSVAASHLGNVEISFGDCQVTRPIGRDLVHSPQGIHVPLNGCVRFAPFLSLRCFKKGKMIATCECRKCNQSLEFEIDQAGQTVNCPSCGTDTKLYLKQSPAAAALNHPALAKPDPKKGSAGFIIIAIVLPLFGSIASACGVFGDSEDVSTIIIGLLSLPLYFVPSVIGRHKKNAGAIFMLNLLAGWTFIGWVVAIVWARMKD